MGKCDEHFLNCRLTQKLTHFSDKFPCDLYFSEQDQTKYSLWFSEFEWVNLNRIDMIISSTVTRTEFGYVLRKTYSRNCVLCLHMFSYNCYTLSLQFRIVTVFNSIQFIRHLYDSPQKNHIIKLIFACYRAVTPDLNVCSNVYGKSFV